MEMNQSALENYSVLQELFSRIPPKDLKICRQVCPSWDAIASSHLSSTSLVLYKASESLEMLKDFLTKINPCKANFSTSIRKFTDPNLYQLLEEFGSKVATFVVNLDKDELSECGAEFQRIIELCKNLKELTLNDLEVFEGEEEDYLNNIFNNIEPQNEDNEIPPFRSQFQGLLFNGCPSLQRLNFNFIYTIGWTLDPEYFTRFFDYAPNVVELGFQFLDNNRDCAIEALKSRPNFSKKLKSLSSGALSTENMQTLCTLRFDCLKKLSFECVHVIPLVSDIQTEIQTFRLLEDFGDLEELKLSTLFCTMTTPFPQMPKLTKINLNSGRANANFFEKCPNLLSCIVTQLSFNRIPQYLLEHFQEHLLISRTPFFLQSLALARGSGLIHKNLRELEIYDITFDSTNDLQSLLCFPGLRILKIKLGSGLLKDLMNVLSGVGIEELELTFAPSENDFEAAISGLSEEECKILNKTQAFRNGKNAEELPDARTFSTWKSLRKLCLINCGENYHVLSGVSICKGLSCMKNVTCLELTKFEMFDDHLLIMLEEMTLVSLNLCNCQVHPTVWKMLEGERKKLEDSFGQMFPHIHIRHTRQELQW